MNLSTCFNTIIVCAVNVSFMALGIFLNSFVIICLLKSIQLRKKLCYFMIVVLSCFDLVAVSIDHPVLIISTLFWTMQIYPKEMELTGIFLSILLQASSIFTPLTLTIERYLAVKFPVFHRTSVTKKSLTYLLAFQMIIAVALFPVYYFTATTIANIIEAVIINSLILFAVIFLNYEMFAIAKTKRRGGHVVPTGMATPSHQERKKHKKNIKYISICSLAATCFFFRFFPELVNSIWRFTTKAELYDRRTVLCNVCTNTLVVMNSTFNCVIFFWRNSILRREGMKMAKRFWTERS